MAEQKVIKVLNFEVKEIAPRVLEFTGSTEDVDRQGDIITAKGWQLKQYKKNPVFMWAHQYADPPIGKALEVWVEDGKLKFHIQFADRETYEFADTIYKLYKGGFLRASSVGFLPLESEPIGKDDEDVFMVPTRFLKQELLELSGCPVPANPYALAEAKAKGFINDALVMEMSLKSPGWAIIADKDSEKPYPNEHACRLRDPNDFQENSFKRTEREHEGKKYSIIMGKLTGETTMTEQAYRYDKEVWTAPEAKSHCADHDGTFESAQESRSEKYECECIKCGHVMETDEHCRDIKCPECGGEMRRRERPGPGQNDAEEGAIEVLNELSEQKEKREIDQETIADEIDFLRHGVETEGLNEANLEGAWQLVRAIVDWHQGRESGSDIPVDIAEKIGAVLNKVNRERLEKIQELAQSVLDSAEKPEEEEESGKELSQEEIKEIIKDSVAAAIDQAKGKITRR